MRRYSGWVVAAALVPLLWACSNGESLQASEGASTASTREVGQPSVAEFCRAYQRVVADVMEPGLEQRTGVGQRFKDWAEQLRLVGVPAAMPSSAAEGLEVVHAQASAFSGEEDLDEVIAADRHLDESEALGMEALKGWIASSCPA